MEKKLIPIEGTVFNDNGDIFDVFDLMKDFIVIFMMLWYVLK